MHQVKNKLCLRIRKGVMKKGLEKGMKCRNRNSTDDIIAFRQIKSTFTLITRKKIGKEDIVTTRDLGCERPLETVF